MISTAIKKGVAQQAWIDAAVKSMTTLNKTAAEALINTYGRTTALGGPADDARRTTPGGALPVHALTDITGFGLIGHLREMLLASDGVSARIAASTVPLLDGAMECVRAGHIPGGLKANRDFAECIVSCDSAVSDDLRTILFDPQTAGGLLAAVAPEAAEDLLNRLSVAGVPAVEIGEVVSPPKTQIHVTK